MADNAQNARAVPPGATENPADSIGANFRGYWRTLKKRWPLIVLVGSVVLAADVVWTYRQPRIFGATCSLVIDPAPPNVLEGVKDVVELGSGNYWTNREFYETQFRVIHSRDVARQVVTQLGLTDDPDFPTPGAARATARTVDVVADMVLSELKVVPIKESRIANVTVEDRNPERAAKIANTVAAAYIDQNLNLRVEGSRSATQWLGDQVVGLKEKLRTSEFALYEFRKKNQLLEVDLTDRQGMTTQNLQQYNQKLTDLRARKLEIEATRTTMLAAKDNIEERESLPEIRKNPIVQQLQIVYIELLKQKADLEPQYGDKHPKVQSIKEKMDSVRRDYASEIDKIIKSVDNDYKTILTNEHSLVGLMEREKKQAIELAQLDIEYRPLAREADNTKRVYELVTQRAKETGIAGLIRSNNVRILESAVSSKIPVSPRVTLNIGLGILLGGLLGLLVAVALEFLDVTLKSQEEVEALLGVPVLGMIPIIENEKRKPEKSPVDNASRDLIVHLDPRSSPAESWRSIRTNLMFLSPDSKLHSIVVTSPGPQEGKTTTAISLAITMANSGVRVLIVDTDLRRPRIHKSLDLSSKVGISSVIARTVPLAEAIVHTQIPNLDALPCGPIPPNPAELLHTAAFHSLVSALEGQYDFVIYDSPPASAVTDPAIITNLVQGAILVIRGGSTSREAAYFARRQIQDAKGKILGAIINQVDFRDRAYGYYRRRYKRDAKYGYYSAEEAPSTTG